jgi:hypothetical protein
MISALLPNYSLYFFEQGSTIGIPKPKNNRLVFVFVYLES